MDPNQQPIVPAQPTAPVNPATPTSLQPPVAPVQASPDAQSFTAVQNAQAQPATPFFASSQPYPQQPTAPTQTYAATTQPFYGTTEQVTGSQLSTQKNIKKPLVIAGIVLAVLLVGGGVFIALKGGNNPISSIASSVSGVKDVVDRKDGTLDVSSLVDEQTTIKNQSLSAKINQQVNLSDGSSYLVQGISRNYVSPAKTVAAKSGKELVKVDLVVGNRRKSGTILFIGSIFKIKNSAGGLLSPEYVMKDEIPGAFISTSVDPGKQYSGFLLYQIDKDEKVSSINTEDTYENYKTNEKATIKSEVSL